MSGTISVGQRYSLAWKHPHRLETTVVALEADHVICEVDHRCAFSCYLQQSRTTLPIDGRMRYSYPDFAKLFMLIPDGSIALTGGAR